MTYLGRLKRYLHMHAPRPARNRHPLIQHLARLQIRRKSDRAQRQIRIAHIIIPIVARCWVFRRLSPEVRRDGNIRDTRHVKCGAVHPDGVGEITSEGVDEDFILVEFEHDVGEPPELFALK